MPLVSMKSILDKARERKYAVLATNMLSLEMILGGVAAAEEMNSPLILQLAPVQFETSPLLIFGPLMVQAAKNAKVPIAVHLDHGYNLEDIYQAIDLGFTSVMFDGSSLSIEDNMMITKKITDYAHKYGVTVEAELGYVGGEGEYFNQIGGNYRLTQPEDVVSFVSNTNCDALAIAIGNSHGLYTSRPNLQFDLLKNIKSVSNVPLVLHGGSGTDPLDLKHCVTEGINKVNLASEIHYNYIKTVNSKNFIDYPEFSKELINYTKNIVSNYMVILGSAGKAKEDRDVI